MTGLIATFGGVGYLRPAPGTWGSARRPAAGLGGPHAGRLLGFAIATFVIAAIGWWAVEREIAGSADKDPSEIVIDEVAGQFVALWPVSYGAEFAGSGSSTSGPAS
jgi:phosphatidylglycerophosphatase A